MNDRPHILWQELLPHKQVNRCAAHILYLTDKQALFLVVHIRYILLDLQRYHRWFIKDLHIFLLIQIERLQLFEHSHFL